MDKIKYNTRGASTIQIQETMYLARYENLSSKLKMSTIGRKHPSRSQRCGSLIHKKP